MFLGSSKPRFMFLGSSEPKFMNLDFRWAHILDFCVWTNLETRYMGSVEPIHTISRFCRSHDLWVRWNIQNMFFSSVGTEGHVFGFSRNPEHDFWVRLNPDSRFLGLSKAKNTIFKFWWWEIQNRRNQTWIRWTTTTQQQLSKSKHTLRKVQKSKLHTWSGKNGATFLNGCGVVKTTMVKSFLSGIFPLLIPKVDSKTRAYMPWC